MDKVYSCLARVRVISGVNHGIIANEQLSFLFDVLNLNEEERNTVLRILEETHIVPIPEDEAPQKVRELYNPPLITVVHKKLDEQTERDIQRNRYVEVRDAYSQALKNKPILKKIYEEEIPIFCKALTDLNDKSYRTANRKIVRACMSISSYRVRGAGKSGWVCGTYMSRVREHFQHWVQMVFREDELVELIECFVSAKELTPEQMEKVMILLHNTPKMLVHRRVSLMFDDE